MTCTAQIPLLFESLALFSFIVWMAQLIFSSKAILYWTDSSWIKSPPPRHPVPLSFDRVGGRVGGVPMWFIKAEDWASPIKWETRHPEITCPVHLFPAWPKTHFLHTSLKIPSSNITQSSEIKPHIHQHKASQILSCCNEKQSWAT